MLSQHHRCTWRSLILPLCSVNVSRWELISFSMAEVSASYFVDLIRSFSISALNWSRSCAVATCPEFQWAGHMDENLNLNRQACNQLAFSNSARKDAIASLALSAPLEASSACICRPSMPACHT